MTRKVKTKTDRRLVRSHRLHFLQETIRQPAFYYVRRIVIAKGYPAAVFTPLSRSRTLTLLPFRNWEIGELVSLHHALGQRISIDLKPISEKTK